MNRHSRLISFWAWSGLAAAFAVFGLWSFGRAGLLAPEGATNLTRPISLVWMASAGLALLGFISAILDGMRIAREHRGARALTTGRTYTDGPTANWLRREVESGKQGGLELDRAWLEAASRRVRADLSTIGMSTRAIAGLLMILAVLGTFAGMRDAVPDLAGAVRGISAGSPATTAAAEMDPLSRALDEVSDAFGANLLALFGAVVLGIGSIGAASGRSSALRELTWAAEQAVSTTRMPGVTSALEASVRQMTQSVEAVGGVQEGLTVLSDTLVGFQRDLRRSLEDLGTNVSRTIQVKLEEQLVHTLESNSNNVSSVAQALAATTVAYEGLLKDQERTRDALDKSVEALEKTATDLSEKLSTGLGSLEQSLDRVDGQIAKQGKAADGAISSFGEHVHEVRDAISAGTNELTQSTRSLQKAVKEVHTVAGGQAEFLQNWAEATGPYAQAFLNATSALRDAATTVQSSSEEILTKIRTTDEGVHAGMTELGETIAGRLDDVVEGILEAGVEVGKVGQAELAGTLGQLKEASQALKASVQVFGDTVDELTRNRERLLDTPPIRVELSDRSIDRLTERPKRRLLKWFRSS